MSTPKTYIACKHCHQSFEGRGRRARRNWHERHCDDVDDRHLGRIANIDTENGAVFNADDVIEALNHMKRKARLIEPIPIHEYPPRRLT